MNLSPHYADDSVTLYHGDNREVLAVLPDESIDACVTDPPYELAFMGRRWDATGIAYDVDLWREVMRVLKPGGHLLAFGGTRTWHRLAVAVEDAGFEVRDSIAWMYGSGFPKSLDVSKAIDKRGGAQVAWFGPWFRKWREDNGVTQKQVAALFPSKSGGLTGCVANWELGFNMPTPDQFNLIRDTFGLPFNSMAEVKREVVGKYETDMGGLGGQRLGTAGGDITAPATPAAQQWQGWGTALKPAFEPVVVARKPLIGTVAENVLTHGTGALNVDGCRIGTDGGTRSEGEPNRLNEVYGDGMGGLPAVPLNAGRWPANVILDESQAAELDRQSGWQKDGTTHLDNRTVEYDASGYLIKDNRTGTRGYNGDGGASRFFYTAKASTDERPRVDGIAHPTVKPLDLMRYLVRLVTPPSGTVLEPFAGSGTTAEACVVEGFRCIAIEREADYLPLITARLSKPIEMTLL